MTKLAQEIVMEVSTFNDDLFELSEFGKRLEKFIEVEHHFIQGSLVLALSSKFGSGKTTFLKMWKSELESRENKNEIPLVIFLNAWESDYYGDPLFAIISTLVKSLEDSGQDSSKTAKSLISAAKDVGWFLTAIGGQIVRKFTGVDAVEAGELAEKKKAKRKAKRKDPESTHSDAFSVYQKRKDAMSHLQEAIKEFVASFEPRVLFLVDELDRCRPDYAISYLETIKHIFDVRGAVFILAADREQLENSAKKAFGPNLDFEEYYRKFVHREVTLPPISESGYTKLASTYVSHYLERDGLRNCFMKIEQSQVDHIAELLGALRLTPRQIQDVFRILGHVFQTSEEKKARLLWCIGMGSFVMAALKVCNSRIFHLLGSQQFDRSEALKFLTDLLGDRSSEWWFMIFLTGGGLKVGENEPLEEVMKQVGLELRGNHLREVGMGWGDFLSPPSRFIQIHEKIEQISQWD